MTRNLTRTNFNSSQLIRTLTDLALVEAVEPGIAFAEKLSLWVDFADAITLCAAHSAGDSGPWAATAVPRSTASKTTLAAFEHARATAVQAITASCSTPAGRTRNPLPAPKPGTPFEDATNYEPYRRFHHAHQREIEGLVRPLRAKVRDVLATASPALRQLATLDAALDGILSERESVLLSSLPLLLAKRFEQSLANHRQRLAQAPVADNVDSWMKAGGWLGQFCKELQAVLIAELDMRLQPTLGLLEALTSDTTYA